MDICKLQTGDSEIIKIEKDIFEKKTKKDSPYYPTTEQAADPKDIIPFAVCPACDNPIQIIGLYKKLQNTDKPYGRHYPKSVAGLAKYEQENYMYCPFANPKKLDKESRRQKISQVGCDILQILKEQFDRAIQIISEDTGIVITENLARTMLKTYMDWQGYLYTGATRMNIPWILAYMSNSNSLYGRIIKDDKLKNALIEQIPDIEFNEKGQLQSKKFLDLHFCFICHGVKNIGNRIEESMQFIVSQGCTANKSSKTIFEKKIIIDPLRFQRLIKTESTKAYRNNNLLNAAAEIFKEKLRI